MRRCVFILGWVSFLLAIGGCDRLPALGGEGQKCFGNGTCEGDLICEEGVCVEDCVPSCADKGCGDSDGCEGTCSACPSGNWCDGTSCQPCDTTEHCGDSCTGCTADPRGDACVDMGGFQCGCQTDLNCGDKQYCDLVTRGCLDCTVDDNCGVACTDCSQQTTNRQCVGEGGQENLHCGCENEAYCAQGEDCDPVSMTCEACQPDCGGRVCGADGCGGQCPPGCNVGTETCTVDGQCESCSNDCTGLACGSRNGCGLECDGLGVECAAGTFCEADGSCVACDLADHCGDLCVDCTGDVTGHQCITSGGPYHCGCTDTSNCPAGRACRAGLCEVCNPDCDGKCGGADDTCDGTCDDLCPAGQCCQDQQCLANDNAQHCGPGADCVDCSISNSNSDCVDIGGSTFGCGCDGDEDCDGDETCVEAQCQAGGDPAPSYVLDVPNCPVTAMALSNSQAPHDKTALLVGCDMDPEERLWFLQAGIDGATPTNPGGWDALTGTPTSLHFKPGTYEMMATDDHGTWHHRAVAGMGWEDPRPIGQGADGGMDDAGIGGGANHACWSASGSHLMAAGTMYMEGDWRMAAGDIVGGQLSDVIALGAYGSFTGLAFTADGSTGVAVFATGSMYDMSWFGVQDPAVTESAAVGDADYLDLAVPLVPGRPEHMSTISIENSQTKVRIWTDVINFSPRSLYSFDMDAHSIAFLPGADSDPSRYLLAGSAAGDLRAYEMIDNRGLLSTGLSLEGCEASPVSVMAVSPDGRWLATACGSRVMVWETSVVRAFFDAL